MENLISIVVNELRNIVRLKIASITNLTEEWKELILTTNRQQGTLYTEEGFGHISINEDYAIVDIEENRETGVYTLNITLHLIDEFLPYNRDGKPIRKIPFFTDLANYGIPKINKDVKANTKRFLKSLEEDGYTTTSPLNINIELTPLNADHEKIFSFHMDKSWRVNVAFSFIDEEDFSIGGKMYEKARERFDTFK